MRYLIITLSLLIFTSKSIAQSGGYDEAQPFYKKGSNCLYNERLDSALFYFKKCQDINPSNYWYDLYIAKTTTRLGNSDNAINQWVLIEHTVKDWYRDDASRFNHILFEEALILYLKEDSINAELLIDKDLINHPGTRGWQLGQLAYFNLVYNNPEQALEYYRQAISFGRNLNYNRNIAKAKFQTGLQKEGLLEMDRIIRNEPSKFINFIYRAEMYQTLNNTDEAISDLEHSISLQKTEQALLLLANIYSSEGNNKKACEFWTIAKKTFKSKDAKSQIKSYCK